MEAVKDLYDDEDLLFFANMGVLPGPVTKANWRQETKSAELFAHNAQEKDVYSIDTFDESVGTGVCGRILDVLSKRGYKTGAVSVGGSSLALSSKSTKTFGIPPGDYPEFGKLF